ncbi:hypothetical protein [Salibacter halophilus]|uniref:DUF4856 domain-containing protein n=1 Tax=Salibacter halophilus TaxID=1803916 RepID=A0A6N6M6Y1_9FLAO|nr:hypothetical protein [Salibacter halophilus]KAB1065558.1 hypothetical protein F3059_02590 [Salibacter halophilus]
MSIQKVIAISLLATVGLASCNKDDDDDNNPSPSIPNNYSSNNFEANAASQIELGDELEALASKIGEGDDGSKLDQSEVDALYTSGLKGGGTFDYTNFIESDVLPLVGPESGQSWDVVTNPDSGGGVFAGRFLSYTGLEHKQLVEKAYFMGGHYIQAYSIAYDDGFSSTDVDKLLALFGTTPNFPMGASNAQVSDRFSAKYAARRTPETGGFYLDARKALIIAKYHLDNGASPDAFEVRDQIDNFFAAWEKSIAATAINYMYSTLDVITKSNPTDEELANALHAHSEAVAFILGAYQLPSGEYLIASDSQLESVLSLLKFNDINYDNSDAYLFASEPNDHYLDISIAMDQLKETYNFTDDQMESFKINWVNEDNR